MPSIPWQFWHRRAFSRPLATSPPAAAAAAASKMLAAAAHQAPAALTTRGRGASLTRVFDPRDRAGEVIGYEQRTVRQRRDVDGPSAILLRFGIEPAFREHFALVRRAVGLQ